jgi:hypothetical protein
MQLWQVAMGKIEDAINDITQVESDVADLETTVTGVTGASYLALGNDATLTAERQLVPTVGDLVGTDNGANSTYALGLATSGVVAGTYGDGTNIPQVVIDAKGRVTSATNIPVGIGSFVPLSLGVEPLQFVSDGAGRPILVAYP